MCTLSFSTVMDWSADLFYWFVIWCVLGLLWNYMVCIVSHWLCFEFVLLTAVFPLVVCLFHLLLLGSLYGNFIIISCMSCGVLHSLVFIQILAANKSLVSCKSSILYCLFCQNIYWPHTYVYFQLIINYYISGGSCIIVTCHISLL